MMLRSHRDKEETGSLTHPVSRMNSDSAKVEILFPFQSQKKKNNKIQKCRRFRVLSTPALQKRSICIKNQRRNSFFCFCFWLPISQFSPICEPVCANIWRNRNLDGRKRGNSNSKEGKRRFPPPPLPCITEGGRWPLKRGRRRFQEEKTFFSPSHGIIGWGKKRCFSLSPGKEENPKNEDMSHRFVDCGPKKNFAKNAALFGFFYKTCVENYCLLRRDFRISGGMKIAWNWARFFSVFVFPRLAKKEEKKRRMAQWAKEIKIETGKESERANGASGKLGKIVTSKRCDITFLSSFLPPSRCAHFPRWKKGGNLMSRLGVLLALRVFSLSSYVAL